MHEHTAGFLRDLGESDWFRNVGRAAPLGDVVVLSSWEEAIASSATQEWEDVTLEAANQFGVMLRKRGAEIYNQWNEKAAGCKPYVVALMERKMEKVLATREFPKSFTDSVRWDLLHVCIAFEFSDVLPAGFWGEIGELYLSGRFPCGWEGVFPAGRIIIF
jgi:hypothetical protein